MDVDYIAAKKAIEDLEKLLNNKEHGEREEIADDIINDDDVYRSFRLYVFNRVLSDALASVGLKLRFTHLDHHKRQTIFTEETCEIVFDHIYTSKREGLLNDFIALDILLVSRLLGKLDCEVYLRGTEILNQ